MRENKKSVDFSPFFQKKRLLCKQKEQKTNKKGCGKKEETKEEENFL